MSVHHHIRQLVLQELSSKKALFSWKTTKTGFFFLFTVLPKHIKIKSLLMYKSVCGRVVKTRNLNLGLR